MDEGLIKAMGALGGGLGAGEVCGAAIGALAAIGLKFGRSKEEEKEDPRVWLCSREFMKRFREEIVKGSILCRDIAKVDWADLNQVKAFYKSEKILACCQLTGKSARALGELLERAEA